MSFLFVIVFAKNIDTVPYLLKLFKIICKKGPAVFKQKLLHEENLRSRSVRSVDCADNIRRTMDDDVCYFVLFCVLC